MEERVAMGSGRRLNRWLHFSPRCADAVTAIPVLELKTDPTRRKFAAGNGLIAGCGGIEDVAVTVKTGANLAYSKALAQHPISFGGWIDDFHAWNLVESAQTQHSSQRAGAL